MGRYADAEASHKRALAQSFVRDVVKPLQAKVETIYVHAGSDAERHVVRRYPHKHIKYVHSKFRLTQIGQFVRGMGLSFERDRSDRKSVV